MNAFFTTLNSYLWGFPMIAFLLFTHLFFTVKTGFVQKKLFKGIRLSFKGTKACTKNISPLHNPCLNFGYRQYYRHRHCSFFRRCRVAFLVSYYRCSGYRHNVLRIFFVLEIQGEKQGGAIYRRAYVLYEKRNEFKKIRLILCYGGINGRAYYGFNAAGQCNINGSTRIF